MNDLPGSPRRPPSDARESVVGGCRHVLAADGGDAGALESGLRAVLHDAAKRARSEPAANPIVALALHIDREIAAGRLTVSGISGIVRRLTLLAFARRADHARAYLGGVDEDRDSAAIADAIGALAHVDGARVSFERFREQVERPAFGLVFTAHPTFSIDVGLSRILAQLVAGRDGEGALLSKEDVARLLAEAGGSDHRPPPVLTLGVEHAWSIEALKNAGAALDATNRIVLEVARILYPERWTELTPRPLTLATWVGYDLDGRADISWRDTIEKRLLVKAAQLERWQVAAAAAAKLAGSPAAADRLHARIAQARAAVERQCAAIAALGPDSPVTAVAAFSRLMVSEAGTALTGTEELRHLIGDALAQADNDDLRLLLLTLRANIASPGLGLGHMHVRLNANQVHNSIRSLVGLEGSPSDPTRRRSYVHAVSELVAAARPQSVGYASILAERASARRLFMLIAQIVKHIDNETPIRFLIAETESGFTLLSALYFARLFGVEDRIEISPLFETNHALEHGDRVIDEVLRNPDYRAYVERSCRLAVQFGFSDSGRYLGQMAATFLIERLRLRIAGVLERHGLAAIEIVLFNTHGESIGRGAHPVSFADRLLYLCPPASAQAFHRIGTRVKEEVSLQGGDGYLWFMHPATGLAAFRAVLQHDALAAKEASDDPVYAQGDFAAEFFNAVERFFTRLVDNPDYAALLGAFGTNLLERTGSRPVKRETEGTSGAGELTHPSQMRAIPNNAVLQQFGLLANVVGGLGGAGALDPEGFAALYATSPRFRRALDMAIHARSLGDADWLAAYVRSFDPAFWLHRAALAAREGDRARRDECRALAHHLQQLDMHDRLARVHRILFDDQILFAGAPGLEECGAVDTGIGAEGRDMLAILHAIRVALILRIWSLATHIPEFSPQLGTSIADLMRGLLHLDVPHVVARLKEIFPVAAAEETDADFGETANYTAESRRTYEREHREIFDPMLALFDLVRRTGAGITHAAGAVG